MSLESGNPSEVVRAALGGIKEAIKVGREIKQTGAEVNSFLDEEARARIAWKKKQLQLERRGDLVFVDAANEYREVRKIRAAEENMYKEIEQSYGKSAVGEVKALITQMRKERQTLDHDFQRLRAEERLVWVLILGASALFYGILKATGAW
jgi:uncharacterized protein with von Willebrand factor type A (vWA) domain